MTNQQVNDQEKDMLRSSSQLSSQNLLQQQNSNEFQQKIYKLDSLISLNEVYEIKEIDLKQLRDSKDLSPMSQSVDYESKDFSQQMVQDQVNEIQQIKQSVVKYTPQQLNYIGQQIS